MLLKVCELLTISTKNECFNETVLKIYLMQKKFHRLF